MKVNIKHLSNAISGHVPSGRVYFLNKNVIILNGTRVKFKNGIIETDHAIFRFYNIHGLLLELWHNGLLSCSVESLNYIKNRYEHLTEN